jgi:outer membrane protein OmpA-like peptidoglycan-associated protein
MRPNLILGAGLALTAVLGVLTIGSRVNAIETALTDAAGKALAANGDDWARPHVDGQAVTLQGAAPSPAAAKAAHDIALASVWTGGVVSGGVTVVRDAFTNAAPVIAAAAPLPAAVDCDAQLKSAVSDRVIPFVFAHKDLAPEAKPVLDDVASAIKGCANGLTVSVEGFTDSIGRPAANQALSRDRAASVVAALESRGVPGSVLEAKGFGADRPVADNATDEGRAKNRRVEFHSGPTAAG